MNIANKLTLFRIVLAGGFVAVLSLDAIRHNYLYALIIFALAGFTDFLDGYIARKYDMITPFGKFLDPIADKILVIAAMVCFVELGWVKAWVVAVIIAREFAVSGFRLAAVTSDKKLVIPAGFLGKLKTASTMVAIGGILLLWTVAQFGVYLNPDALLLTGDVLMYICAALTVISGGQYMWSFRHLFSAN